MITIGQLARYVGVSPKTIRVYHAKGLLPEPERDGSGYRRYSAADAIELIKIRALAEAGVPLARIRHLAADDLQAALSSTEADLTSRIEALSKTRDRLRDLASGQTQLLPADVETHLRRLGTLGFSQRWTSMERDLWILVFATRPDTAHELFTDQSDSLTDPALLTMYLEYDRIHDLPPDDAYLDEFADRIVRATLNRYGPGALPGQEPDSPIPQLVQSSVNASSPAWERLDSVIRQKLKSPPSQ